jgi:hypothetical protein
MLAGDGVIAGGSNFAPNLSIRKVQSHQCLGLMQISLSEFTQLHSPAPDRTRLIGKCQVETEFGCAQ